MNAQDKEYIDSFSATLRRFFEGQDPKKEELKNFSYDFEHEQLYFDFILSEIPKNLEEKFVILLCHQYVKNEPSVFNKEINLKRVRYHPKAGYVLTCFIYISLDDLFREVPQELRGRFDFKNEDFKIKAFVKQPNIADKVRLSRKIGKPKYRKLKSEIDAKNTRYEY